MFNAFRGTKSTIPFHRILMAGSIAVVLVLGLWVALMPRVSGVQAKVLAELTASNNGPTELGDSTSFTATITGGSASAYAWSFGDGNNGTGITTTHTYTQSGVYTATVVATTVTNSLTATAKVFVGDAVVDVLNNRFSPRDVTVPVGGKVVWVLREGFHSVTADDGSFNQPAGNDWPPFIHTFNSAGTTPYHCTVHGASGGVGMSGSVIVAGEGGEFTGMHLPDIRKHLVLAQRSYR
jgi:plastocyanin